MINGFITVPRAIERFPELQELEMIGAYTGLKFLLRFREDYIDGVRVGVNQLLISKPALARKFGITVSKLRWILGTFEKIGGISCENVRNKYTLITFLPPFLETAESDKSGEKGNPPPAAVAAVGTYSDASSHMTPSEEVRMPESQEKPEVSDRGELTAYGTFHNIYLSEDEYYTLRTEQGNIQTAIDKLSAYLENYPEKSGRNHYAQLLLWISNEKNSEVSERQYERGGYGGYGGFGVRTPLHPDPNASYDLERAERRAREKVPKLKKRDDRR